MIEALTVKIMSPVAVVFESKALSISAENSEGIFDILPDHARFMTLINNTPIVVELPDASRKTFTFENAVLFFEDNNAVIYIQETLEKITE